MDLRPLRGLHQRLPVPRLSLPGRRQFRERRHLDRLGRRAHLPGRGLLRGAVVGGPGGDIHRNDIASRSVPHRPLRVPVPGSAYQHHPHLLVPGHGRTGSHLDHRVVDRPGFPTPGHRPGGVATAQHGHRRRGAVRNPRRPRDRHRDSSRGSADRSRPSRLPRLGEATVGGRGRGAPHRPGHRQLRGTDRSRRHGARPLGRHTVRVGDGAMRTLRRREHPCRGVEPGSGPGDHLGADSGRRARPVREPDQSTGR